ncbi:hypothetical protein A1D22_00735 [Pasteurellaceae bacterium LFhippo2]|nr:hypothetical protein [Pasteurellaceae bacterium LFhippo2]
MTGKAKKYSLPARKWYTLEQAVKRINKLTGEEIEVADLLHYYSIGVLNLSVYFVSYPARLALGNIEFTKRDLCKINIFNYDGNEYEIEDLFRISNQPRTTFNTGFSAGRILYDRKDKHIFISGFLNLYLTAWNNPRDIFEAINKGLFLNGINYLLPPKQLRDKNIVIYFSPEGIEESVYLPIEDLIILDDDLNDFLQGNIKRLDIPELIAKAGRPQDERHRRRRKDAR